MSKPNSGPATSNLDQYIDNVTYSLYSAVQEMIPDTDPVTVSNVQLFLSNSMTPTTFSSFSLGTFSGLGTSFHRSAPCSVRYKSIESRVTCKVNFENLQATLPKFKDDEDVKYDLLINASGLLILSLPKDQRNATVKLMTLSSVNFTMQVTGTALKKNEPTSTPSMYNLDEDNPTNFKQTYRLVFEKFVTDGKFIKALDAALASVPKVNLRVI
ncbi:uncharacterized protein LOC121835811, partial [Ixodes scapularis]|uniref:uncharacterized protein LOC121835811 n=1 Tax=Ixodes scapularis TaxID=6945 RepID=UPI001C38D1F3